MSAGEGAGATGSGGSPGPRGPVADPVDGPASGETCDHCGATTLEWRKCKLICLNCGQIVKSCADL